MKILFGQNAAAVEYKLQGDVKWNQCAHHPKQGLGVQLQNEKGEDVFVITGPAPGVTERAAITKALGDKYTPGHAVITVPKHLFEALPVSDH